MMLWRWRFYIIKLTGSMYDEKLPTSSWISKWVHRAVHPQSLTNWKSWFPSSESPFSRLDFQVNHVKLQGCKIYLPSQATIKYPTLGKEGTILQLILVHGIDDTPWICLKKPNTWRFGSDALSLDKKMWYLGSQWTPWRLKNGSLSSKKMNGYFHPHFGNPPLKT